MNQRISDFGRFLPGRFSIRNLPIRFRAAPRYGVGRNGEKWWNAVRQLLAARGEDPAVVALSERAYGLTTNFLCSWNAL